jgi:predicted ATPase
MERSMKTRLRFFVRDTLPEQLPRPAFRLVPSDWDDYGHRTQFKLLLHHQGSWPVAIGQVKILAREQKPDALGFRRTGAELPREFTRLDPTQFCSLGQSPDYYAELTNLPKYGLPDTTAREVLEALADICFWGTEEEWWQDHVGFKSSLLRFASAHVAHRDAHILVRGETPEEHTHNSLVVSDNVFIDVKPIGYELRFDGSLGFPGRANVLVGRNGAGKTTLLRQLAAKLGSITQKALDSFHPRFSSIICVSTNSFDEEERDHQLGWVHFVGVRPGKKQQLESVLRELSGTTDDNWGAELLKKFPNPKAFSLAVPDTRSHLEEDLLAAREITGWCEFAARAFDDAELVKSLCEEPARSVALMSAGQKALATVYAGLFHFTKKLSLILVDEPENFLHPSLVAIFIRQLGDLLEDRKAFAIIATHSPIVVQETPARFVTIVERKIDVVNLSRPPFETFGESIENIDRFLFETDFDSSNWKRVISSFVKREMTDRQIAQALGSAELPLLAQAYAARERTRMRRASSDDKA